jgi:hypothetical protein
MKSFYKTNFKSKKEFFFLGTLNLEYWNYGAGLGNNLLTFLSFFCRYLDPGFGFRLLKYGKRCVYCNLELESGSLETLIKI